MTERYPLLEIDLDKIRGNAEFIASRCAAAGITVAGVTKGVCGSPLVARALLEGGVRHIADSRLENIARLRDNGVRAELMLLRLPMLSEAERTVQLADISLNSEFAVIRRLAEAAERSGRTHKVILMIELGDLREGVAPEDAVPMAVRVAALNGVRLAGVGANLTCYGGVAPSVENMTVLAEMAEKIEKAVGFPMEIVSGGNTSSLRLAFSGDMPKKINHLRLGESLLLGLNSLDRSPIAGTSQDAFTIKAEIIEVKTKGSLPVGKIVQDAFGDAPKFEDRGDRRRAILAIGREDILVSNLAPEDLGAIILGASSDHLLVDIQDAERLWVVGDVMAFRPGYGALLAAMTSSYVAKRYSARRAGPTLSARNAALIGAPSRLGAGYEGPERAPATIRSAGLKTALERAGWTVHDAGDAPLPPAVENAPDDPNARNLESVVRFNEALADKVAERLAAGETPIVLGGDHSVSIGVLAGVRRVRPRLAAIFFDAHADFNTDRTSPSHNIHGMVVSACVGLGNRRLVECGGVWPKVEPESLAIVGVRDIDPEEREALRRSRTLVYTMEDIDYLGVREVIERVVRDFAQRVDGIHVSFDIDALDPTVAPAVSVPAAGGISAREAYLALEILSRSGVPLSMDIVELNPARDRDDMTAKLAAGLVATLFGKRIL